VLKKYFQLSISLSLT